MIRIFILAAAGLAAAACTDNSPVAPEAAPDPIVAAGAGSPKTARVTNTDDAGPGSFRAAVLAANADASIKRIQFIGRAGTIALSSTVEFTGTQDLQIDGNRSTIDGGLLAGLEDPSLRATGGGDLSITTLTFRNAPGPGVDVEVPASSSGIRKYSLVNIDVIGNGGHGVVINDQTFPELAGDADATPPVPPNPDGSSASLHVTVTGSSFHNNGFGALDRDGLRINEGGEGHLIVKISLTKATNNGADGIELDERGEGNVDFEVFGSQFSGNGAFALGMPDPDLDDGIDVDESMGGHLIGKVILTSANDNYEEGFDFNENDAGDLRIDMSLVEASRNLEEGIDLEEDDDFAGGGDLITTMSGIVANGNAGGDAGVKIREKGVGDLDARLTTVQAGGNETRGIQLREDAGGSMVAELRLIRTDDNAGIGIDFDENGTGGLSASVKNSGSRNNDGFGVRADDQGADGASTLVLTNVTLTGNIDGPSGGGGVTITP